MKKLSLLVIANVFIWITAFSQSREIINSANFDDGWGEWTAISIFGDQVWDYNNTFGIGGTPCAKMSGYQGATYANEDWLISPSMNFNNFENEVLTFYSAMCYPVEISNLTIKLSTNYQGSNPNTADWTTLWPVIAVGNPCWLWTFSEEIDLSQYSGSNVRVAFVYISNDVECETWEIDNVTISGNNIVGLEQNGFLPQVEIFPNPANDYLNIIVGVLAGQIIKISNIHGQLMFSGEMVMKQTIVDLSSFENGVYLIEVFSEKNVQIKRIIKN